MPQLTPHARPRALARRLRAGFTFVELAVSVAVLLVIMALLLPALTKARRQAQIATCLSNLHQIQSALKMYVQSQNDRCFEADFGSPQMVWTTFLRPMTSGDASIWFCPNAASPSFGQGTADLAWGPFDAAHGSVGWMNFIGAESSSYGFNGWLYDRHDLKTQFHLPSPYGVRDPRPRSVPCFGDCNWIDAAPLPTDAAPADLSRGAGLDEPELGRFDLARHQQSINMSFLDGHAEQVKLDDLRAKRWSSQ